MHQMLKEEAAKEVRTLIEAEKRSALNPQSSTASKRRRKIEVPADDKIRQSRERNREHARSTRLRKKAYVKLLATQVNKLAAEVEQKKLQQRVELKRENEKITVRKFVLKTFLHYHSSGCADARKWNAIIEPDFQLAQPITPFRSFDRHQAVEGANMRMLSGVEEMIDEAVSMRVMMRKFGMHSLRWIHARIMQFASRHPKFLDNLLNEWTKRKELNNINSMEKMNGASDGAQSKKAKRCTDKERRSREAAATDSEKVDATEFDDNTGSTSSSELAQHDYNAPTIPDFPLDDGDDKSGARIKAPKPAKNDSASTGTSEGAPTTGSLRSSTYNRQGHSTGSISKSRQQLLASQKPVLINLPSAPPPPKRPSSWKTGLTAPP